MADLKTLFHNPESLSDTDLRTINRKLSNQRMLPYLTGAMFSGLSAVLTFKSNPNPFKDILRSVRILAPAFIFGFAFGGYLSFKVSNKTSHYNADMDPEILEAFEAKYVERSLNACGYGNNALTAANDTKVQKASYKKPY